MLSSLLLQNMSSEPTRNGDAISNEDLMALYRAKQANEDDFNSSEAKSNLVDLLGGADYVLTRMLQAPDDPDSLIQKSELHHFLNTRTAQLTNSAELTWWFDPNDCILPNRLVSLVFNRVSLRIFIAVWLLTVVSYYALITMNIFADFIWVAYATNISLCWLFFIPWCTGCVLSLKRKVFRRILGAFDFYVKCVYALMLAVTYSMYQFHRDSSISVPVRVVGSVTLTVFCCLLVVIVSSLDALPRLPQRSKMKIAMLWATVMIVSAIYVTTTTHKGYVEMDFTYRLLSCLRIMAIFSSKQALYTWLRKDRCICITYSPFLRWMGTHDEQAAFL